MYQRLFFLILTVVIICSLPLTARADTYPVSCEDQEFFQIERHNLVEQQLTTATSGQIPLTDTKIIDSLKTVYRHAFVHPELHRYAYQNRPLPIGFGQTISQPYIVGLMTELLKPRAEHRALEIGTGSGYQAAILAELVETVYSIEIIPELAKQAQTALDACGYDNVKIKTADGYYGWEEYAPYDLIILTAAASHIAPPLIEQLSKDGRMIIPVGPPYEVQTLMLVEKTADGSIRQRSIMPVRFVPFLRDDD